MKNPLSFLPLIAAALALALGVGCASQPKSTTELQKIFNRVDVIAYQAKVKEEHEAKLAAGKVEAKKVAAKAKGSAKTEAVKVAEASETKVEADVAKAPNAAAEKAKSDAVVAQVKRGALQPSFYGVTKADPIDLLDGEEKPLYTREEVMSKPNGQESVELFRPSLGAFKITGRSGSSYVRAANSKGGAEPKWARLLSDIRPFGDHEDKN